MSKLLNIREICKKHGLSEKAVRGKFNRNTRRVLPRPPVQRISGYVYAVEDSFLAWLNSPPIHRGRPKVRSKEL